MKYLMLMSLILLSGCASIHKGEVRDIECRVLGIDASIPIPFAKGVNIMNIRLGWVETKYTHLWNSSYSSKVSQNINYLGSVNRESYIGASK